MKPLYKPLNVDELAIVVNVLKRNSVGRPETNQETHYKYLTYFRADIDSSGENLRWYQIDQREYDLRTKGEGE